MLCDRAGNAADPVARSARQPAATEFRKKESAPAAGQRARRAAAPRDKEIQNLRARIGGRAMPLNTILSGTILASLGV